MGRQNELALLVLIAVMFIIMAIIVGYQVISRFALSFFNIKTSAPWTEELARYLMIWSVFLGAAYATRKSRLISIEILDLILSKLSSKIVKIVALIISLFFYFVILKIGYNWSVFDISKSSTVMGIPMIFVYLELPLSALIMIINSLTLLAEILLDNQMEDNENVDLL